MTGFAAMLRAVNVGGTGRLVMRDLIGVCARAGLACPRTSGASGNVVFDSDLGEVAVKSALEAGLASLAGRRVDVLVRELGQLARILERNPFPHEAGNRVLVVFLDRAPPAEALSGVRGRGPDEALHLDGRELFIHYGSGVGGSRLALPETLSGTARNLNTLARLVAMAPGSGPRPQSG